MAASLLHVDEKWRDLSHIARLKLDNYEMLGTSEAEKDECANIVDRLLVTALQYSQGRTEL